MRTLAPHFGEKLSAFGRAWGVMAQCRATRRRMPMRSARTFRPALEGGQSVLEARNLLSVAAPLVGGTAPTIWSAEGLYSGPPPIGKNAHEKLVDVGFTIEFSEAIDPTRAENAANYTVLTYSKHGMTMTTTPVRISFVKYFASQNEVLIKTGKQTFPKGGELEVNGAPPSGIADSTDTLFLTGNTTFVISPNAKHIYQ
jgi:hypothetical protein